MSNIHRLRLTDKIFFVTCNLRTDRPRFDEEELRMIIGIIDSSRRSLGFLFCGYVLMPDHWHALIAPHHPLTISKVMETVKSKTSGRLNKRRATRGPNWQHQFWDRFVRHSKEFAERLHYMHYNPVRRGLVTQPDQWRWSSHNNFSLDPAVVAACPIAIDIFHLSDSYRA
jgi:REP element-mobilizing transposase RayT